MDWTVEIGGIAAPTRAELLALPRRQLPKGSELFTPGGRAEGFPVLLRGRIEVCLTAPTGREMLLYAVEPGQSCVQTTLSLLGDEPYSGTAVAAAPIEVVVIPKGQFLRLMDDDTGFRRFVLRAFGQRMGDLTRLLEQVAFGRVESRLAAALIELAQGDTVHATQAEIAARIGSAREVVSRRLDAFTKSGWVATERGEVHLRNPDALRRLAGQ